jgi:hypothetical protein
MTTGADVTFMFAGSIKFLLTAGVVLAMPSLVQSDPMPRDAELVELFRSHRDAFERLAAMGMEDAATVSHVSVEALKEEPLSDGLQALSPERRREYVRLLSGVRTGLSMGSDTYGVCLSYWGGGAGLSVNRSWEKGIAYLPHGYERVWTPVTSLDKVPTEDGMYVVPIERNWYIYYSQLD